MFVTANLSPADFAVAFVAALAGAAVYEPFKAACGARRAKGPPLTHWLWQVTYLPGDHDWRQLWSIELVKVHRRGNRVWGTMYRVYPSHHRRRWVFEGQLHEDRHLSLVYRSVGKDYGSNGTVNLGLLKQGLWCGAFQQIPEVERGVELRHGSSERRQTRRIGPDFTEEALIEWLSAEDDFNDPVRGFLAAIPAGSPASPREAAKHLPPGPRLMLTEPPPCRSSLRWGLQAVAAIVSMDPILAGELARRKAKAAPRPWASPTRKALGIDEKDEVV